MSNRQKEIPGPETPEGLAVLATYLHMSPRDERIGVYQSHMDHLLEDIQALEGEDATGLEPAFVYDPRWR